jgi:hypothetical protein
VGATYQPQAGVRARGAEQAALGCKDGWAAAREMLG